MAGSGAIPTINIASLLGAKTNAPDVSQLLGQGTGQGGSTPGLPSSSAIPNINQIIANNPINMNSLVPSNPTASITNIMDNPQTQAQSAQLSSALSGLQSLGNNWTPPPTQQVPDMTNTLNNIFNNGVNHTTSGIDWSQLPIVNPNVPAAKPGGNWLLQNLFKGLNDTFGQLNGLKDSVLTNLEGVVKNGAKTDPYSQTYGIKQPGWMNWVDMLSPQNLIGGTALKGVEAGLQNQWNDWTKMAQGQFTPGDFPGVGFLSGMANHWSTGSDVLKGAGITNPTAQKWGGLGFDIATDPLNFAAGGKTLATKLGENAAVSKTNEIADSLGVASKAHSVDNIDSVIGDITNSITRQYQPIIESTRMNAAQQIANDLKLGPVTDINDLTAKASQYAKQKWPALPKTQANFVSKLQEQVQSASKNAEDVMNQRLAQVQNDIKGAQVEAYNSNINNAGWHVPFTNATTATHEINPTVLGLKNPLFNTEAKISPDLVNTIQENIGKMVGGDTNKLQQITDQINNIYKTNSLSDLTKTNYNDIIQNVMPQLEKQLVGKAPKPLPDSNVVAENLVNKTMPNQTYNINTRTGMPVENVQYKKLTSNDILGNIDPNVAKKIQPMIENMMNDPKWTKDVPEGFMPSMVDGLQKVRQLAPDAVKMYGDFAKKLMKTAKGKTLDKVQQAFNDAAEYLKNVTHTGEITKAPDIVYQELERQVEHFKQGNPTKLAAINDRNFGKAVDSLGQYKNLHMSNAKTAFEHFLDSHNPFNARTLNTKDKFVNSMADHLADANTRIVGEKAQYAPQLNKIDKFISNNAKTDAEKQSMMNNAIYHLEGQAPKSYPAGWKASDAEQTLAGHVKDLLSEVALNEKGSGALRKTMQNYFPHVYNRTINPEDLQQMIDRHPELKGLKQTNNFDKSRTGFKTMADWQDALKTLEDKAHDAKTPEEAQQIAAQHEKLANMYEMNIPNALNRRIHEGVRSSAMKAMQGELSKYNMLKVNPDVAPTGLTKLDASQAKKFGLDPEQQNYMHPDVLKGMEKVDGLFKSDHLNKIVRNANALVSLFRTSVTTVKPSHYLNNLIQNSIMNMVSGVKMSDMTSAFKILSRAKFGKNTDADAALLKLAYKHGVVSSGFIHDLTHEGLFKSEDPTKLEKLATKVSNNKIIKGMQNKGEVVDNMTRLANFINGMKKYRDAEQAAKQVRTYHFNYHEMTNADRGMRTIVPFWNWMKNNIPLQAKLLQESPQALWNIERTRNTANQNQPGADYQKTGMFHIPTAISNVLGGGGHDWYTSMASPTDDLKQFLTPVADLGNLNPAITTPFELAANKDFYTGNPITYGKAGTGTSIPDGINYALGQLGIVKNMQDLYNTFNPPAPKPNAKTPPPAPKSWQQDLLGLFHSVSQVSPKNGGH